MTMQTVLITGASSGIGQALAVRYAAEGATLGLLGRNSERLDSLAAECGKLGATVRTGAIDVRSRAEMKDWIEAFDRTNPVDLVFANAGVMEGTPPGGEIEASDMAAALIEVNVIGVLNTIQPVLPAMMARGRGQIAVMSSLAAFVPLADAPSYCASKSAVLSYGLSLRTLLAPRGIRVNVICPGYITTPMMLRESGPKPFEMAPQRAADLICRGLARDRAIIAFPFLFALATRINGVLPDKLRRWALRHFRFTVSDPT
jgi:NADP-dependent 3-hydroxy acid dehydrogenase YdfG